MCSYLQPCTGFFNLNDWKEWCIWKTYVSKMIRKKIADALCSKAVDQHDIVCAVISLSKIVETAKKLQHDLFRTVTEHEERIRRLERSSEKNDTSEIIKFQMSILEKMNTIEKMINVAFPVENQTFEIENGDPY